jgi:hypothetical protein
VQNLKRIARFGQTRPKALLLLQSRHQRSSGLSRKQRRHALCELVEFATR